MRPLLIAFLIALLTVPALAQGVLPTPLPTAAPSATTGDSLPRGTLSGVGATPIRMNANIRSGPGLAYRTIGRLEMGKTLDVVGHNGYDMDRSCAEPFMTTLDMWIQVLYRGRRGWIARCTVVVSGDVSRLLEQPAP